MNSRFVSPLKRPVVAMHAALRAAALPAVAVCVLLAAGCGGGGASTAADTTRAAAGSCREIVDASAQVVRVQNRTPFALRLENTQFSCREFSGSGTPTRLDATIPPGSAHEATLSLRSIDVRWVLVALGGDTFITPVMVKIFRGEMTISSSTYPPMEYAKSATIGEISSDGRPVLMTVSYSGTAYTMTISVGE